MTLAPARLQAVRNTGSNLACQITIFATWVCLTPFLLRTLGAGRYGLWVLMTAVIGQMSVLDLGIAPTIIKRVAEYRARAENDRARALLATATCLYAGLGLLAILLAALLAPAVPRLFDVPIADRETAWWLVLLSGVSVALSLPCAVPKAVLQGLQRFDVDNAVAIGGTLAFGLAAVVVLRLGGGPVGLVATNLCVTAAMQAPRVWFILRAAPELRFGRRDVDPALVRHVLSFGAPFATQGVAEQVHMRSGEIVIGAFLPVPAVTPYAIAKSLSEAGQKIAEQFSRILLPLASELHASRDLDRLRSLCLASTRLTLALFLLTACPVAALAGPILTVWLGAGLAEHAGLVLVLTFSTLIETSLWPASGILQGMGLQRRLAAIALLRAVASVGLAIVLVRPLGLPGVAAGALLGAALADVGLVVPYARRALDLSYREVAGRVLVPALLPAVPAIVLLHLAARAFDLTSIPALAAAAGLGALTYAVVYLCVGASRDEIRAYRGLILDALGWARVILAGAASRRAG